ncbi:MAG: hypothetical protein IJ011_09225 [Clostridia bacterium]|nr:hypothetical protein [Clostridia bacterium]
MTAKSLKINQTVKKLSADPASVALGLFCIFSLLLIFKNPDVAITHMTHALGLCAKTVIPSLFPFMALSELLVSGKTVTLAAPLIRRPARAIFGISGEGAAAVALGLFCGFPIGAKSAVGLYKNGRISKWELTRILTFSNNPSSAFLISAVGASMFDSRSFGVLLFAISTISALIVGFIGRFSKGRPTAEELCAKSSHAELPKKRGVEVFTGAVTSSALSMLYVCAFVVFFSTLVGVLEYTVNAAALPDGVAALWFGFFELTSGIWKAAQIPVYGAFLAAAIAGWSGLSVHFQIMSICSGCEISFKPYLLSKLLTSLINTLLLAAYALLFGLPL